MGEPDGSLPGGHRAGFVPDRFLSDAFEIARFPSPDRPIAMAKNKPQGEPYNNRALFERSVEPVFILNNRRRLRYANPAWEKLVRQSLEDAYNLHCVRDRRASPLAQALSPPAEVMAGKIGQTRRAAPP